MHKWMILGLLFISVTSNATEYLVAGDNVNFRSSPHFRGSNNVIRTLNTGTRLVLVADHGSYIEATTVPGGVTGFIWKEYVELANTHDYYRSGSAAFPTLTPDTADPNISTNDAITSPMCGCTNCRRSSPYGFRTHPIHGDRRLHRGCDIAAPRGTDVYAIADGTVKSSGSNSGYGITVDIEHLSILRGRDGSVISNRGYTTRHAHLLRASVSAGQTVRRGQKIGQVNSTGASTGHHLHFEIAITGQTIDPERVIDVAQTTRPCSTGGTDAAGAAQ